MRRLSIALLLATVAVFGQTAPNPSQLNSNWWSYYEGPEYQEHIEASIASLHDLEEKMDEPLQERASPLISKAISNLNTLLALKQKKVAITTPPPHLEESYAPSELIALAEQLQGVETKIKDQESDIIDYRRRSSMREGLFAKLTQRYKGQKEGADHLILGLRIMVERSYLEILREKLRLAKEELLLFQSERKALQGKIEVASERLDVSLEGKQSLIEQREVLKQQRQEAVDALLAAESAAAATFTEEEADKRALLQQQMVQREANELLIRAKLLFLDISEALAEMMTNGELEQLNEQSLEWSAALDEISEAAESLRKTSLIEPEGSTRSEGYFIERQATFNTLAQVNIVVRQSEIVLAELQRRIDVHLSESRNWLEGSYYQARDWSKRSIETLSVVIFTIGDVPITPWALIKGIFVLIIGYLIAKFLGWGIGILSQRRFHFATGTVYKLKRLVVYVVMIISVFLAIIAVGFDLGRIALIAGALSVGIGFGLKNLASNFVSGLALLLGGRLRVGDYVETQSGHAGRVKEIYLQNTVIHTFDGIDLIVPNETIMTSEVFNWTFRDPYRRIHVPFSIAYGTDKELVKKAVLEAADRVPMTVKKVPNIADPDVRITEFGDNGIQLELIVWINQKEARRHNAIVGYYLWEIETSFKEHGIVIPFPQRDVHIKDEHRKM